MSGNQVKAEAVAAGADDWAQERKMHQRRMIEIAEEKLGKALMAEKDVAALDRHVRAITNMARAVVAIEAIRPARPDPEDDQPEDEMGGRRDDDPAALEALRARVMERYDQFAAEIEREERGGDVEGRDAVAMAGGESVSGTPSETADDGLAHLADAGRAGGGQDVRWRVLAA
ncbi:hypothetical protein IP78_04245 [Brevundimonas sp. AAP58]|nr:hypothetical protein IP78_04245 [Brevundimonas sp. AAP58]